MEERSLRVFLIEDDEDDYILIKEMLSKIPSPKIEIQWFNDYEGGLQALCSQPVDACLMDYRLGERSGLELLKEVIQKGCEAPIVLLTGQGDHEVDVEAMKAGAYDYLVKGQISPDLLERSIRFAMERNRTEKELRRARADLEVRVRERTADLSRANEELRRENTERRRVEEALRESEERYRVLVEGAQDIIFRLSSDGSVLSLNPAFQFLTGEPVDRWLGERFFPLVHPDDQTLLQERLLKILEGEFLPPVEVRVLTRAIGYRILELKARPQIHDGRVMGAIGTARDITDRKTVEEDLRSSRDEMEKRVMKRTSELSRSHETLRLDESRLEALLELNRISGSSLQEIADYVLDQQIRLTGSKVGFLGLMNHEETLFTVSSFSLGLKEQCGAKGQPIHFPLDSAGLWAASLRERRAVIVNDYAVDPRKRGFPEGHVSLRRLMTVPVLEGSRVAAIAVVANKEEEYNHSDLRQVKLLMEGMWKLVETRQAKRALRAAEDQASLGRALSAVAHDIKTPLIAIGGYARLVQGHLDPENPDYRKLEIVLKETERLEGMLRQMLDFSRPLELNRTRQDVVHLARESILVARPTATEKGVDIQLEAIPPLREVLVDSLRMKQVLINLLMNAVQASPGGKEVKLRCYCRGETLSIDIIDRGYGIRREQKDEIFSPFFTTKKGGTGLGLPIVKKIVETHGGEVKHLENPEGGTIFRVQIPLDG